MFIYIYIGIFNVLAKMLTIFVISKDCVCANVFAKANFFVMLKFLPKHQRYNSGAHVICTHCNTLLGAHIICTHCNTL